MNETNPPHSRVLINVQGWSTSHIFAAIQAHVDGGAIAPTITVIHDLADQDAVRGGDVIEVVVNTVRDRLDQDLANGGRISQKVAQAFSAFRAAAD